MSIWHNEKEVNLVIDLYDVNIKQKLSDIKSKFKLTDTEIAGILGTTEQNIKNYDDKQSQIDLGISYNNFHCAVVALSTIDADIDYRLKAYIQELFFRYKLNTDILEKLSGIDKSEIQQLLNNPTAVTYETKYKLSITVTYLLLVLSEVVIPVIKES